MLFRDDEARGAIKELALRIVAMENRYEERIRHLEAENERGAEEWRMLKAKLDTQERAERAQGSLRAIAGQRERLWRS